MLKKINNKKKFLKKKKKNDLYLNKCLSKKNFDSFFEQLIKK